ncbi:hypothetical protein L1987_00043 [Smallanthus sonchifolius]|uniref:Uncharacterized protein n=1 Tax=Smallanthus sonchifolius TaxID=185202 RepID=A0ACB9K141_9ASTR|nr:hypothetical protein L1987_00043 [Smallanthus sonchifolius]
MRSAASLLVWRHRETARCHRGCDWEGGQMNGRSWRLHSSSLACLKTNMKWNTERGYWGPVHVYVGGAEHAVLHLLYSRFWHQVLYDIGVVSTKELFKCVINQGIILEEVTPPWSDWDEQLRFACQQQQQQQQLVMTPPQSDGLQWTDRAEPPDFSSQQPPSGDTANANSDIFTLPLPPEFCEWGAVGDDSGVDASAISVFDDLLFDDEELT